MSNNSARQTYQAFTEWLTWFNKETGRNKKPAKTEVRAQDVDKSFRVDVKGFRKQKK
jgi:hypothetical protein